MEEKISALSVIVPFYKGNKYIERLLRSINRVAVQLIDGDTGKAAIGIEVIIVNDSPSIAIMMPDISDLVIRVKVYGNDKNMGIHATRVNGLKYATGEVILFLDQDDELMPDGFKKQLLLSRDADVVVGNGFYQYGKDKTTIYKNKNAMLYLIQKKRFLEIRNLIPSPGECLLKKKKIPQYWLNVHLSNNGADDFLLWLLLFNEGCKFVCNEEYVYIHNDAGGQNLSLDLGKMHDSCMEMCERLKADGVFSEDELNTLSRAIDFKFYQDTKQLSVGKVFKYIDIIWANVRYKLALARC